MKKREVPIKNYVFLSIIIVTTVFITFYLAKGYKMDNDYYENLSPLNKILNKVKVEELDNYLLDNPNIVIYIIDGNEEGSKETEEVIKKLVLEKDLKDDMIVIDATNNIKQVTTKIGKLLSKDLADYKTDLLTQINFFAVKDRIIDDVLVPKTNNKETITSFLIKNGIV